MVKRVKNSGRDPRDLTGCGPMCKMLSDYAAGYSSEKRGEPLWHKGIGVAMGKRIGIIPLIGGFFAVFFCSLSADASIGDIKKFLDTCPVNDPIYSQIKMDFTIRHNVDTILFMDSIVCSEPVSAMPISQYSDDLIILQSLRVMYYMDKGQSGHLPWTSGALYPWLKSQIKGFDIKLLDKGVSGQCCEALADGLYMEMIPEEDSGRNWDRTWQGISQTIGFFAHEARHLLGPSHDCSWDAEGNRFIDDNNYNPGNLSSFGVQWWLEKSWLYGDIQVGISCQSATEKQDIISWHLSGLNTFRARFCSVKPTAINFAPADAGGVCRSAPPMNPWKVQTVDSTLDQGRYASVGIDSSDNTPYVSYYDASGGRLRLAHPVKSGGNCGPGYSWSCQTIDSGPSVGKYNSLALRYAPFIWKRAISYVDEANHALQYYLLSCNILGCSTTFDVVDNSLSQVHHTSLKFDSSGTAHIAYQGSCGAHCSQLKYASFVGSGGNCAGSAGRWQCEVIDSASADDYGLYVSLDLYGNNLAGVASYDRSNGDLRYSWVCGSSACGNCGPGNSWRCDVLDSTGDVGLFPSLHASKGGADTTRIAYYDRTNGKLKMAEFHGTVGNCGPLLFGFRYWQCDAVDSMGAGLTGNAGISLSVDSNGTPLVAYMDASEEQASAKLKVARRLEIPELGTCGALNFWQSRLVDAGGPSLDEGIYVSLAFNSKGQGILAYYEEDTYYSDGNLKVALFWEQLFLPFVFR